MASRADPPWAAAEQPMLDAWLEYQRDTLAMKCAGLSPAQLVERSVAPSTMTLLGLVRHMAEVERNWFRRVFAGQDAPPLYYSPTNPDGDFDDVDGADPDEAFATWRGECDAARAIVAVARPDDVGARPREGNDVSLRWILVHMIEEYARHNGHADLLRERIDGVTGE
jgi:hypothetical protein